MNEYLSVKEATYLDGLRLQLVFNNNKKKVVDFSVFLTNRNHPQFNKYKKPENFKHFKIENGNVVWGKNWDMIFPVHELYTGNI